jgi:hypothetical protein
MKRDHLEHMEPNVQPECQKARLDIEGDPLGIGPETLGHVSTCRMCSEARVLWLTLDDFDNAMAPASYFDDLPGRVLRKLPAQSTRHHLWRSMMASAASLMLLAGIGGYWLGRQGQPPMYFEAVLPPREFQDISSDPTSFSSIELFSQIPDLSPEETSALMMDLIKPESNLEPATPEED